MTQIKLGDKKIPFIYQGSKLLYPNPVKDGLLLWYDFNGISNGDAWKQSPRDLSVNGNNGVLYNFAYTQESGYNKNGLKFDGVDDYLSTPNLLTIGTIELCLDFFTPPSNNKILYQGNDLLDYFYIDSGSNFVMRTRKKSTGGFQATTMANYVEKDFIKIKHLTIVQDNFKFNVYINGVFVGEKLYSEEALPFKLVNIFNYNKSKSLDDALKSVKVYSGKLSAEQIQHNYKLEKERWEL